MLEKRIEKMTGKDIVDRLVAQAIEARQEFGDVSE
jgi:hypothetical protein